MFNCHEDIQMKMIREPEAFLNTNLPRPPESIENRGLSRPRKESMSPEQRVDKLYAFYAEFPRPRAPNTRIPTGAGFQNLESTAVDGELSIQAR